VSIQQLYTSITNFVYNFKKLFTKFKKCKCVCVCVDVCGLPGVHTTCQQTVGSSTTHAQTVQIALCSDARRTRWNGLTVSLCTRVLKDGSSRNSHHKDFNSSTQQLLLVTRLITNPWKCVKATFSE